LAYFPLAGPLREHFGKGVRAVVCGSYLAYFRPLPDKGRILRVLHGAQDAAAIADRGGFDA